MENKLIDIAEQAGLHLKSWLVVHGGDINDAYQLTCSDGRFFLKLNHASKFPQMFEKEARGLNALRNCGSLAVPRVIAVGLYKELQYLLLEWLEPGKPGKTFWEDFGRGLALIHKHSQKTFGWEEDNYIGSLVQKNQSKDNWSTFYSECRIMPLVRMLHERKRISNSELANAESLTKKLNKIFPHEPPALLHGDLWSGNFMTVKNGMPATYDPAVYFGNREMDLGMSLLFGGFDSSFYNAYNEAFPLEQNWKERVRVTQLYPVLVHAVLFDGHYVSTVASRLTELH